MLCVLLYVGLRKLFWSMENYMLLVSHVFMIRNFLKKFEWTLKIDT